MTIYLKKIIEINCLICFWFWNKTYSNLILIY